MSEFPAEPDLMFLRRRRPGGARPVPAPRPAPAAVAPEASPGPVPSYPDLGFIRRRRPRPAPPPPPPPVTARPPSTPRPGPIPAPPSRPVPASSSARPTQTRPAVPAGPAGDWLQQVEPLRGQTVLTDERPRVCLGGEQGTTGSLQITLNWSRMPVDPRSRAAGLQRSTDIHLGCLWATTEGTRGVVQAYRGGPDAAVGVGGTLLRLGPRSETEGQTLTLALRQAPHLQRLLLFAYADGGHPEWEALGLTCTATLRGGIAVQWGLDPAPPGATICALGSLHRVGGTLVLRRESGYENGQQQSIAEAFGYDLVWLDGRTVVRGRVR